MNKEEFKKRIKSGVKIVTGKCTTWSDGTELTEQLKKNKGALLVMFRIEDINDGRTFEEIAESFSEQLANDVFKHVGAQTPTNITSE